MFIDTHVHLDNEQYCDDVDEVVERALTSLVDTFIIPGADPQTLDRAVWLSEKYSSIYFSVGVHPYDIDSFSEEIFEKYTGHPKCVGVGECGLDYYRLEGSDTQRSMLKDRQKDIFIRQIEIAKECKKPLIVHIRDASSDAKEILLREGAGEIGGVLHCYNADEQLLALADHNFYFGIGGVATFKNAKKLVDLLPRVPVDRVIFETDAPYLTPHPHRGKRNEPAYIPLIVDRVAQILNLEPKVLGEISSKNAKELFML